MKDLEKNLGPTPRPSRNTVIDFTRGCAVLGILKMNLIDFALPSGAEKTSALSGKANMASWWFDSLFVDGRFRTLFFLLFGASLLLASPPAENLVESAAFAVRWIRRNLWLTVFWIFHAYVLLCREDILFYLGLAGMGLVAFRSLSPRFILMLVLGWLVVSAGVHALEFQDAREVAGQGTQLQLLQAQKATLTPEEEESLALYEEQQKKLNPSQEEISKEIEERRGGYLSNLDLSARFALEEHQVLPYGLEMLGVVIAMLAGMGLFRAGILSGERSPKFYWRLLLCAYGLSIPVQALICRYSRFKTICAPLNGNGPVGGICSYPNTRG